MPGNSGIKSLSNSVNEPDIRLGRFGLIDHSFQSPLTESKRTASLTSLNHETMMERCPHPSSDPQASCFIPADISHTSQSYSYETRACKILSVCRDARWVVMCNICFAFLLCLLRGRCSSAGRSRPRRYEQCVAACDRCRCDRRTARWSTVSGHHFHHHRRRFRLPTCQRDRRGCGYC